MHTIKQNPSLFNLGWKKMMRLFTLAIFSSLLMLKQVSLNVLADVVLPLLMVLHIYVSAQFYFLLAPTYIYIYIYARMN